MLTESILALAYLGVLAIWDAKTKELPAKLLRAGTVLAIGMGCVNLAVGAGSWGELFLGAAPGAVLLILAWLTKSVGIGDGVVLLQLNFFLFFERVVLAFAFSLLAAGGFALALLIFRRCRMDRRLPYMPFLWIGCLFTWLVCG